MCILLLIVYNPNSWRYLHPQEFLTFGMPLNRKNIRRRDKLLKIYEQNWLNLTEIVNTFFSCFLRFCHLITLYTVLGIPMGNI